MSRPSTRYINNRQSRDPLYKALRATRSNLSIFLRRSLQNGKAGRSKCLTMATGATPEELFQHLLDSCPELTAENYGREYEIDHIVPVSEFEDRSNEPIEAVVSEAFDVSNLCIVSKKANRPGRNPKQLDKPTLLLAKRLYIERAVIFTSPVLEEFVDSSPYFIISNGRVYPTKTLTKVLKQMINDGMAA